MDFASIVALIGQIISLGLKIFDLFWAERAKAIEEQRKYEVNQETFRLLVEQAILKARNDVRKDNEQIGKGDDVIDKEISNG